MNYISLFPMGVLKWNYWIGTSAYSFEQKELMTQKTELMEQ